MAKATLKRMEQFPTGEVKLTLLYGPDPVENPGVPNIWGVSGWFSITATNTPDDTVQIDFEFNFECPANCDIRVWEFIYNDLGILQCSGAASPDTVTFLAGEKTHTYSRVLCTPLLANWSIRLFFERTVSEIPLMSLNPNETWSFSIPYTYIEL